MLEFTESLFKEIRSLKKDTEELLLTGRVTSMEQYKHLMGRLEGYNFVEDAVKHLLKKHSDD